MNNFNRILLIILTTLTLGILVEIGFYLYISTQPKKTTQQQQQPVKTTQTLKDTNAEYLAGIFKKMNYDEVMYIRNILTLNHEKNALSSLLVTTEIKGTVVDIDTKGGYLDPATSYKYKINIALPERAEPLPVFYTSSESAKITVNTATDAAKVKDQTTALQSFKKGDGITIKETYDLVNFHLVKGEISKSE